jgi:hypothetical protein
LEDYLIENYGVENGRKGDEETDEGSEMKMEKEKD